jgi:phage tail-like protein
MAQFYPPVSFYFSLAFTGVNTTIDASFMEVSGMDVTIETEDYKESGENRFRHRLPTSISFSKLELKRGFVPKDSDLGKWVKDTIETDFSSPIQPKDITVKLLDEDGQPLMAWSFYNAWPVKWDISKFNSKENEVAVETIQFSFNYFQRITT